MAFGKSPRDVDLQKATKIVKELFESIYDNLSSLDFRVLSVEKNDGKDMWNVRVNLFTSITSDRKASFVVKVNVETGAIISVKIIEDINRGFKKPE